MWLNPHWWSDRFEIFKKHIAMFSQISIEKVLPVFEEVGSEGNQIGIDTFNELISTIDPEHGDPASVAEASGCRNRSLRISVECTADNDQSFDCRTLSHFRTAIASIPPPRGFTIKRRTRFNSHEDFSAKRTAQSQGF